MKSVQMHFIQGYFECDKTRVLLSLSRLAHDEEYGIDDMSASKNIVQNALQEYSSQHNLSTQASKSFEKWIPVMVLLANCNFLEHFARKRTPAVQTCLVLSLERSNTALNLVIDSLRKMKRGSHFGFDVGIVPILFERMRVSARQLSSFGATGIDPLSLYRKALLKCYAFLTKVIALRIKNADVYNCLAVVLIELLKIFPFSIGTSVSGELVKACAFYASRDLATLVYFYHALHLISLGNVRDAERALAKSVSYGNIKFSGTLQLFWTIVNMQRGLVPVNKDEPSASTKYIDGFVVALLSGRVDVFDITCCSHLSTYLKKNLMLIIINIRQVVLRNMIHKHRVAKNNADLLSLQDLWCDNKDILDPLTNSHVFPTLDFFRDGVLLPLLVQRYINGCLHIDHGCLNLPTKNAFPEIELPCGPLVQPGEPTEK